MQAELPHADGAGAASVDTNSSVDVKYTRLASGPVSRTPTGSDARQSMFSAPFEITIAVACVFAVLLLALTEIKMTERLDAVMRRNHTDEFARVLQTQWDRASPPCQLDAGNTNMDTFIGALHNAPLRTTLGKVALEYEPTCTEYPIIDNEYFKFTSEGVPRWSTVPWQFGCGGYRPARCVWMRTPMNMSVARLDRVTHSALRPWLAPTAASPRAAPLEAVTQIVARLAARTHVTFGTREFVWRAPGAVRGYALLLWAPVAAELCSEFNAERGCPPSPVTAAERRAERILEAPSSAAGPTCDQLIPRDAGGETRHTRSGFTVCRAHLGRGTMLYAIHTTPVAYQAIE